jgi:hypothetical protein
VFLFSEQGKEKAGFGLSKGHIQRITKKITIILLNLGKKKQQKLIKNIGKVLFFFFF